MTDSANTPLRPNESWLAPRRRRAELSRYFDLLRSHWLLLVAFIAAGLVAAFAYVSIAPKTYTAQSNLLVTPVAEDDPNLIGLPLVRDTADPTADVLTVAQLVTSPDVSARVARQLGGNPNAIVSHVSASPVTESEIIAIQATASSPGQAARLANAFAQQTVQFRTNALHAQLAKLIPTLQASMRSVAATDRSGLEEQLAVLDTLRSSPDPTVSISSPATRPTSPASPDRKTSLAAGGFVGLVTGLLVILALNALDPKLRDEDQLREIYDLPLLTRIPKQRAGRSPLTPRELVPPVAEAFRTLRAAFTVRHGGGDADHGSAILVTGDAAAAGKTTVALNLAMSLTAAGKQVIVIEADLRRPSIGQALRVRAPRGVAEILLGKAQLLEALVWIPQHGPQLELLLGTTADAAEIDRISPESARQLVREAREMCDFVVIDSPPMTDVGDALAFAEEADDVLLVARVGNSQVRKMSDLGELLTRSRIVPAGIVLVGVSEPSGYYYRGAGEQHVFGGLLQRRARDHQTLPASPRVADRVDVDVLGDEASNEKETHSAPSNGATGTQPSISSKTARSSDTQTMDPPKAGVSRAKQTARAPGKGPRNGGASSHKGRKDPSKEAGSD